MVTPRVRILLLFVDSRSVWTGSEIARTPGLPHDEVLVELVRMEDAELVALTAIGGKVGVVLNPEAGRPAASSCSPSSGPDVPCRTGPFAALPFARVTARGARRVVAPRTVPPGRSCADTYAYLPGPTIPRAGF